MMRGCIKFPLPGATEFTHDEIEENDENEDGKSIDESQEHVTSTQHQNAAFKRHEPLNKLKRECAIISKDHPDKSNAEIARLFIRDNKDKVYSILIPSNAKRTLTQTVSEFKNNAD